MDRTVDIRKTIASRVAEEIKCNQLVNLGIGIPTLVANYLADKDGVMVHSENGIIGLGGLATDDEVCPGVFDAASQNATLVEGAAFMDSGYSFGLIRRGAVDVTVLGALQVDESGNLANWMIPGKMIAGYGGAVELVNCSKRVIVAMEHTVKGKPKIMQQCMIPLTGVRCVDLIVTELCVLEVTDDGLLLKEIAENTSVEAVKQLTDAELIIPQVVGNMKNVYMNGGNDNE
ncbi:MAG: 3-oxoacid CoA-transferase subunit B [Lachnospiraceae bacterium]